jgi:hypothetical protein
MNGNKSVTATFLPVYDLSVTVSGQGQVGLSPPNGPYLVGTLVTLTATPGPDHVFSGWSGSIQTSSNPVVLAMNGPRDVTAVFTPLYALTLDASGEGIASASPPGPLHLAGTVVTLSATPDAGSAFTGWSGALTGKTSPATLTMDGPKTVTASFTPYYPLTLVANGGGSVSVDPPGGSYVGGTVVTISATADPGQSFTGWSGALSGTQNPRTLRMNGPRTVTANFTALYTLTLLPSSGGSIGANPSSASYSAGSVVTLTATPSPGFVFTGWGGALSGTANPAALTVDGNATVEAHFAALYTLDADATSGGRVSVEPPEGTYLAGTLVTLTATPDPGWDFDRWSGDLGGSANPTPLAMDADKRVTAVFAAPEPSQALLLLTALASVARLARARAPSTSQRGRDTPGAPARRT